MKLAFKHSGHLGDIVYSLPLVKAFCVLNNATCDFFIAANSPSPYPPTAHPAGGVMMTRESFDFIAPLLETQSYIDKAHFVPGAGIPPQALDLDSFRNIGLNPSTGMLPGLYRKVFGIPVAIEQQWLFVDPPAAKVHAANVPPILVSRSLRYHNTAINYSLLGQFERIGFVGLKDEYQDFVERYGLSNVENFPVRNALEFAGLLLRSQLFIGNQSFGFAVAEGLKVNRALEDYEPQPNVIPIGGTCIEFINTQILGRFLEGFFKTKLKPVRNLYPGYQLFVG